jgi:hypothetical protein
VLVGGLAANSAAPSSRPGAVCVEIGESRQGDGPPPINEARQTKSKLLQLRTLGLRPGTVRDLRKQVAILEQKIAELEQV